jgi:hypothetical protein
MNFTFKLLESGKLLKKIRTHSKRELYTHLRSINWKKLNLKTYLRVSYGKHLDVWGKYDTFYNDGWFNTKDDLEWAIQAFIEETEVEQSP